jgi:iron(III) transport system substrate-binding protein
MQVRMIALTAAALVATAPAFAETLTPVTREMLAALKVPESALEGLDAELKVPQAWIDGAKKEGAVKVRLTSPEPAFANYLRLYQARYPGVEVEYFRGLGAQRAVQPLVAFKRGTYVTDVVSSFETLEKDYRDADALEKIADELPAYNSIRPEFHSAHGIATAWRVTYYCTAYSKKTVKKEDLPKDWDALVDNPRWRNGKVGMASNFNVWLAELWGLKGSAWGESYMNKLFTVLKPQYRKENLSMAPKLAALGEYDLSVPSGDGIVYGYEQDGLPIGYHCPTPVPAYMAWVGIFKGNPHRNGARLFVNWLLSKEGQLAAKWADDAVPAHKGLERKELMSYPEEILGKPTAPLSQAVLDLMPEIAAKWHEAWTRAGGPGGGAR